MVDFRGKVLSSRRCSDMSQDVVGGVSPFLAAQRHRRSLDRFVEDCLDESGLRAADLAGVAVSTEPGLVICLKVGVDKALALCRYRTRPTDGVPETSACPSCPSTT